MYAFRKYSWAILGLLIFFNISAHAQQLIKGTVIDAVSRQPMESAMVTIVGGATTYTDQFGNFSFFYSNDSNQIKIAFTGYKTILIPISNNPIKIELQRDIINLEEVVVMHSSRAGRFNNLARIDLELNPVKNSQELLRVVPGLFVAQHAGGGKAEQIFLRGFDIDHGTDINISVDGLPVNMVSHAHGQGYADAHFIIPETVNNIDFGAGPYYTQQGNLNTAGYVSFSTFHHLSNSRIQVEAGRYQTYRTLLMLDLLKKNKDKQSAYIAGEINTTNGPTLNPQNFSRYNLFAKYRRTFNEKTQLMASLSAFKSKWDASGQVPERAVASGFIDRFGAIDPSEGGNTERYNANLQLTSHIGPNTTWETQLYASRYLFNLYSNFTFFLNDPINGDAIQQSESRNLYGLNTSITTKKMVADWTWNTHYGTGIRYDITKDSRLAQVVNRQFISNTKLGDINEANAFAFVQQQWSSQKWLIEAGIRADYLHFAYTDKLNSEQLTPQGKMIFSPKLNIQYHINRNLQLYIKAGKGFHSNDTRVVVAQRGQEILPAAYGGDIGFTAKPSPKLLLNIAAWYLYSQQEFVYVGDDGNVEPSGRSRREGIDVVARYQITKKWFANGNLTVTRPKAIDEPKGQNYIPLAPILSSNGGIFYKATTGWNGGISYRYLKNRPANEDNTVVAKGYFVTDLTLNYTHKKYEVGIAIENLFNTTWNEAQFATTSQLRNETSPVTELNFTPGTPFFPRIRFAIFF